ncbi:MAG: hypothetical protein GY786_20290 [Proteobacteria bacterium]|nr:hypothetical protein [Pseudomonadota bacterium]
MPHTTLVICSIFSILLTLLVVVKPLFLEKQKSYFTTGKDLKEFDESVSILEMISEMEIDYKMGKISKSDFDALSIEYKRLFLAEIKKPPQTC